MKQWLRRLWQSFTCARDHHDFVHRHRIGVTRDFEWKECRRCGIKRGMTP